MDRMTPLDATFLHVEDGIQHMHIASCGVFEGPPPPYEDVVALVGSKLPLLPRYRQRARFVPLGLGRPVWVDDPHFHLGYHLRHTALPAPGGVEELRTLMARLMAQELDRRRPLWEIWMVEGVADDRWALISKVHHCMVDGVRGTDLLALTLDTHPQPAPPPPDEWEPAPEPSGATLAADALLDLLLSPYERFRAVRAALRGPRWAVSLAAEVVQGLRTLGGQLSVATAGSLNGPIGPHRRWTWATASLASIKAVRATAGATVNDVVLAAVARGFRDLLLARGEDVEGRVVRALVPVNTRSDGNRGHEGNVVSAMFADLPVSLADHVERLRAVQAQMAQLKASHEVEAAGAFTSAGDLLPAGLFGVAIHAATGFAGRWPQHFVNTVVTNVPGPQMSLYLLGRRLLAAYPYVPLASGVQVGVAVFSYDGELTFGVTGDLDAAPDIDVLASGIEAGVAELVSALATGPGLAAARVSRGGRAARGRSSRTAVGS